MNENEAGSASGVDGWVSSRHHEHSERAASTDEIRAVYAHWASSYDEEMLANDLQSYKSVTRASLEVLSAVDMPMDADPFRVMDAGCGTGLLGQHFLESLQSSERRPPRVHLLGVDLSPEMLRLAKEKGCFDELHEGDLRGVQAFAASSFDLIISSGVFLTGHCGPETLGPLLDCLRPGGVAVFTVRSSFFQENEAEFLAAITGAECQLLQASVMPYYGEIEARVLTVTKPRPCP